MTTIEILKNIRRFIRDPYVWPGGYPLILIMTDGETLCPQCARDHYKTISRSTCHDLRDGWQAIGIGAHWEGQPIICSQYSKQTESAYGDIE